MPNDYYRAALLASIPLLWCGICLVLSWASGWWVLAKQFPARSRVDGPVARMRTGSIGPIHYHSMLTFVAAEHGIRISIFLPFRIGHPPLFIPWEAFLNIRDDSKLFSQKVKMSIGQPAIARVVFPGWVKYHMPLEMRFPAS
ncbi:hypothetical protein CA13_39770 [Planctomycetes bacterium CA13]|uniref:Uncharacterized protein n=2 Tax=Novipirellula herctigrandis TaxID=2527986 RepID=A0A5C5Z5I7_9BACT|nr:hypothetical protein CA13_39770 [Planctomycetes bacterium CA13]